MIRKPSLNGGAFVMNDALLSFDAISDELFYSECVTMIFHALTELKWRRNGIDLVIAS